MWGFSPEGGSGICRASVRRSSTTRWPCQGGGNEEGDHPAGRCALSPSPGPLPACRRQPSSFSAPRFRPRGTPPTATRPPSSRSRPRAGTPAGPDERSGRAGRAGLTEEDRRFRIPARSLSAGKMERPPIPARPGRGEAAGSDGRPGPRIARRRLESVPEPLEPPSDDERRPSGTTASERRCGPFDPLASGSKMSQTVGT